MILLKRCQFNGHCTCSKLELDFANRMTSTKLSINVLLLNLALIFLFLSSKSKIHFVFKILQRVMLVLNFFYIFYFLGSPLENKLVLKK